MTEGTDYRRFSATPSQKGKPAVQRARLGFLEQLQRAFLIWRLSRFVAPFSPLFGHAKSPRHRLLRVSRNGTLTNPLHAAGGDGFTKNEFFEVILKTPSSFRYTNPTRSKMARPGRKLSSTSTATLPAYVLWRSKLTKHVLPS